MTRSYSIYEAKAKLSELIRLVKQKQSIYITDRGVPVAQVIPIENKTSSLEERLQTLQQLGLASKVTVRTKTIKSLASRPGTLKRFLDERE